MVQRRPPHGNPPAGQKLRWVARWKTPGGTPQQRTFSHKSDAVDFENRMKADAAGGDWVDPQDGTITLRQLAEEAAEEAVAESTRTQHRYYATQLGDVGETPIGNLSRRHLQRWVNQLTEGRPWADGATLGTTSARNLGVWVCGLLRQAKKDRRITANPAEGITLPDAVVEVMPADIPTVAQVHKLMMVARSGGWETIVGKDGKPRRRRTIPNPTFARLVGVMASTGMRPAELAGLRWSDIREDMSALTVSVQATKDGRGVKAPKTRSGVRTIPLCPEARALLVEQRDEGTPGPAGTVFGTRRGARFNSGRLRDVWVKFCEPSGLAHLRFYSLRHFFASMQIHAGTSPVAVSRVMGHKNPSITLQVYTHLWNDDMAEVSGAVESVLWANDGHPADSAGGDVIKFPGQVG